MIKQPRTAGSPSSGLDTFKDTVHFFLSFSLLDSEHDDGHFSELFSIVSLHLLSPFEAHFCHCRLLFVFFWLDSIGNLSGHFCQFVFVDNCTKEITQILLTSLTSHSFSTKWKFVFIKFCFQLLIISNKTAKKKKWA